jgi:hypothetical protein
MSAMRRSPLRLLPLLCLASLVPAPAHAHLLRLTVEQRTAFADPNPDSSLAFEKLTGHFTGELDPRHRANAIITDLSLAPRNSRGFVEYTATFTILKPVDLSRASGVLAYQVANRGTVNIESATGYWADFRRAGHVIVASGWQADIPVAAGRETLAVPIASNPDGTSLTGPVVVRFTDVKGNTMPIIRGRMSGTATPASLDTAQATLTRRLSDDSQRTVIKPADFAFADCRQTPFPGKPDPGNLCLKTGFDPNAIYELAYLAKDPPVHGIGFAATRDLNSFLRSETGPANPVAGAARHTIAQGTSQSGNYLRSFLHLGFNQDERGRRVFDGMNPNIAARQLAMNIRFAAPSGAADLYEPGSDGVVWWSTYEDQARHRPPASLLDRCTASSTCPKIVETFGSAEFYSLRMSPDLVGTRADRDIPLPNNVRRYYIASVPHGSGRGGFQHIPTPVADACCVLPDNPNSANEIDRALLAALVDWVVKGTLPPPSRYPRLDRGDLAAPTAAALGFPLIPGQPLPDSVWVPLYDYDFGPGFHYADVSGIISLPVPLVRQTLPMLMPRVDADGNELAGVRSVWLEAPLGTYTGWNPIARGVMAGHIQPLGGGYIPFAKTKAERLAAGDPRLSLEERYGTHDKFVEKVRAAAARLVDARLMLADDAARLVNQAERSAVLR